MIREGAAKTGRKKVLQRRVGKFINNIIFLNFVKFKVCFRFFTFMIYLESS